MHQQFELNLCNYTLYGWLAWVGMMASLFLATSAYSALPQLQSWGFAGLLLVWIPIVYGVYRVVKKAVMRPALITVDPNYLTIHYLLSGATIRIAFDEVVSYRDEFLRDGRELRFRLHSGQKVKLATNRFLGPTGDYDALLQAVKAAVSSADIIAPVTIVREQSFFEKRFSTLLLLVCGAALVLTTGRTLLLHQPIAGSFFTALGAFLSYLAMWYRARVPPSS